QADQQDHCGSCEHVRGPTTGRHGLQMHGDSSGRRSSRSACVGRITFYRPTVRPCALARLVAAVMSATSKAMCEKVLGLVVVLMLTSLRVALGYVTKPRPPTWPPVNTLTPAVKKHRAKLIKRVVGGRWSAQSETRGRRLCPSSASV